MSESAKIYRYPLSIDASGAPYVMVTRHKASYAANSRVVMEGSGHCALYMPMGISIADSMSYETAASGMIGGIMAEQGISFDSFSAGDVGAIATKHGPAALGVLGAGMGKLMGGSMVASILGGGVLAEGVSQVINEKKKTIQKTINPREFMLFKSPNLRSFSLRFRFIPDSSEEADAVDGIVKWFREGMYPKTDGVFAFDFPFAFQIQFMNLQGIPMVPEMFLESASTTWNPNSMSYLRDVNNRPVELNLSLEFKELMPLTRESIQAGF
mgnify:CR=1 FL=1|tara:strand:- start:2050 stop:2856 length:807 start_codon:yes stop_codon:yes gene_type:complete